MTESTVRRVSGLSRATMALIRKELREGEHYTTDAGRIDLTKAGVAELRRRGVVEGSLSGAEPDGSAKKNAAAAELVATVARGFPNLFILEARTDAGEVVKVRVRDNRLFVPGQRIPIVAQPDVPTFLLGCRQPHVRGKLAWKEGES